MDKEVIDFIILTLTFSCAFEIHSYAQIASTKGWPVGTLFLKTSDSLIGRFATFTVLISLGLAFYLYNWWTPLAVVLAGLLFMFLAVSILKERVQILSIIGAFSGFVLCAVYVLVF